jgi:hypothetical protein
VRCWLQSLLSKGQSRWAKEMLGNVRKACCVAGVMALVPKDADVLEVRPVPLMSRCLLRRSLWYTPCHPSFSGCVHDNQGTR